jgi:5-methylcytosine-specific restriction endonuclease McrA
MQSLLDLDFIQPPSFGQNFYRSEPWLRLRYLAIQQYGGKCQCCGQRPAPDNPLQVDHIRPRSLFPHLALDPDNLQVLCRDCNVGKSNIDCTDWRAYDATM